MTQRASASRVVHNAAAALFGSRISTIIRTLATLQAAAYLGETGWGLYGYIITTIEIFRTVTSFGFDTVGVRAVAITEGSSVPIIRTLLRLKTASAGISFLAILVLSLFIPDWGAHRGLMLLLALGLFPQAYTSSLGVRFQAEHAMARLIPTQSAVSLVYFLAVQMLVRLHAGVAGFLLLNVGAETLNLALTWMVARWTWGRGGGSLLSGPPAAAQAGLWRLVLEGLPMGLVEVVVIIYSRLGIFLLEHYHGIAAVGRYYAAYRIAEPLTMIGGALSVSALPVLSRLAARREIPELRRMYRRYSLGGAVLSVSVALPLSLLSDNVLNLLKPEFVGGAGALTALAWASGCMLQNHLSSSVLYAFGKYHWVAALATFNLGVYILLGFALVPRLGPTGAGIATLGTEGLNALVQIAAVTWLLGRQRHARPLAAQA